MIRGCANRILSVTVGLERAAVAVSIALSACSAPTPDSVTLSPSPDASAKRCGDLGCITTLSFNVTDPYRKPLPGRYVFEFEADGQKTRCEAVFPNLDYPVMPCEGPLKILAGIRDETSLKFATIESFVVPSAPASLHLRGSRDGVPIVDQQVQPAYVQTRPNGAQCEPTCRIADVPLDLSATQLSDKPGPTKSP